MAVLGILFWSIVLAADIAFMTHIKALADKLFPVDEKRPGGAGTPTRGRCQKMTDAVYTITKEMSSNGL